MGSPLGPALAKIFVGYYETELFRSKLKPEMYNRYMNDTFVVFNNESQCDVFLDKLNSLHPSLHFIFEKESNCSLPFLDVLVEKLSSGFITSIYRKPTFSGQYIRWNSLSPQTRKIPLNHDSLSHRILSICSPERLQSELDKIKFILLANENPDHITNSCMARKIKHFHVPPQIWTGKMLCLPTSFLARFCFDEVRNASENRPSNHYCITAVEPRVFYTTSQLLPATKKVYYLPQRKAT